MESATIFGRFILNGVGPSLRRTLLVAPSRAQPGKSFLFLQKNRRNQRNIAYYECRDCLSQKRKHVDSGPKLSVALIPVKNSRLLGDPDLAHNCYCRPLTNAEVAVMAARREILQKIIQCPTIDSLEAYRYGVGMLASCGRDLKASQEDAQAIFPPFRTLEKVIRRYRSIALEVADSEKVAPAEDNPGQESGNIEHDGHFDIPEINA